MYLASLKGEDELSAPPQLPLVYTPQQLITMCTEAIYTATECSEEIATICGHKFLGRYKTQEELALANERLEELADKEKRFRHAAQEYAEGLVGTTVVISGTVLVDKILYTSNNFFGPQDEVDESAIACAQSHVVTERVDLSERKQVVITRFVMLLGLFQIDLTIQFYFDINGEEHYLVIPQSEYYGRFTIDFT